MRALVKGFPARPLAPEDVETLLSSSMTVPAPIRANLVARQIDGDDVLRTLQVPLLVTQAAPTRSCSRRWPDHILATCPVTTPSWYEGVGHTAHLEQPDRCNHELATLTRHASA